MDDQGKWEVRIQALLAKAESTNSEEERASILEKVDDLMAKWGIDRAMIEARRIADGAPPRLGHLTLDFEGMAGQTRKNYLEAAWRVAMGLGNLRGHRVRNYKMRGNQDNLYLFGFESDLEAFSMLWSSLQTQIIVSTTQWWKSEVMRDQGCAGFPASVRSKMKRDYIIGYSRTLYKRLSAIRTQNESQSSRDTGGSSALVLVDRKTMVDRAYEEQNPDLRAGRASKARIGAGSFEAGRRDGARADIGQKRFSGGNNAIER